MKKILTGFLVLACFSAFSNEKTCLDSYRSSLVRSANIKKLEFASDFGDDLSGGSMLLQ